MIKESTILFPTQFNKILDRIAQINPVDYSKNRNYINGSVSYLSPYISRGVISTKYIYQELQKRDLPISSMLKFIQELAWRDYWQQVWIAKETAINSDLKHAQKTVVSHEISKALYLAKTGISAIDTSIDEFYKTGYLHNHVRMYVASIACNIAKNHWRKPAQWMYYYLLDADWASNALSWQWVAGSNSNKKYYANQENINNFCHSNQIASFLDVSYDDFESLEIPEVLKATEKLELKAVLPNCKELAIDASLPLLVYNFYNLDPLWRKDFSCHRILLLEPSHFEEYPICEKTMDFVLDLSKNIENIQVYVGEFNDLKNLHHFPNIYYKEHPLNNHYRGIEDQRDWMFTVNGYSPSFFSFWKKCKKEIQF